MASAKLTRTNGTATTGNIYTWSAWVKRGLSSTQETLVRTRTDDNNYSRIRFDDDGTLVFEDRISSSTVTNLVSNAQHRDLSAWYHVVVRVDYTQATAGDRARIYVNGSEVTYSSTTRQSQSGSSYFNSANSHDLGHYNSNNYFNGSMTHVHFTDGYSYAPSTFGETDSTSGIWKPKTAPSVTYGNNGYFLKMENSGAMGTDSSGNSNNFTVSGTLTQNVDTPSNNFATWNPLTYHFSNQWQANTNGNTTANGGSGSAWKTILTTLGVSSGKYYFEAKLISSGTNCIIGAVDINDARQNSSSAWYIGQSSTGQGYQNNGASANGGASYGATYANNDIIGVAMDLDNSKIYFHKNGTYQNSGDPTSGATGTGAISLTANTTYAFAVSSYAGTVWNANFGNGYFGTTAVASAGTAPSEGGIFEYNCPSGYQSLCTKGINSF